MDNGVMYVLGVIGVLVALEFMSRGRGCLSGIARMLLGIWRIVVGIFIIVAILSFTGLISL